MLFLGFNIELRGKNRSHMFQIMVQIQSFFNKRKNHYLCKPKTIGNHVQI